MLAQPLQVDDKHYQYVQRDEHWPKVEVKPIEHGVILSAQIENRDNAHDFQGLNKKEATQNGHDFVLRRFGESHYVG
tara:strand:- start:31 stop:261 length:231 start_codon:yes stop_codon:yes gene_type:complete